MKIAQNLCMAGIFCSILLISCAQSTGGSNDPEISPHTVRFDYNFTGGVVTTTMVNDGEYLIEPTTPTRADYDFVGWYLDKEGTGDFYDFEDPITADVSLYAKWDDSVTLGVGSDPSLFTVDGFTEKLFGAILVNGLASYKKYSKNGYTIDVTVMDDTEPNKRETIFRIRYSDTTAYVNGTATYQAVSYIEYFLNDAGISFTQTGSYLSVARSAADTGIGSDIAIDKNYQNDFAVTQFFEGQGFGTLLISAYGKSSITVQSSGKFPAGVYVLENE